MTVGTRGATAILILLVAAAVSCTSVSPSASGAALADEYYNLGNDFFDLKKYDKAARAYQTALKWNPELKIATVNLARTKAELGDTAGALALLGPVAESDPENLVVAQYLAWLTAKQGGTAAAADLYADFARRLPGDATVQFNAGLSLRAAQKPQEALAAFRAWKALDGKSAAGLTALAELLEETASEGAADAWYDAAASYPENDPKRFAPLARRAQALEAARLFGDAVQTWDGALALPSSADQQRGEALFRRGSLLLLQIEDYQAGSQGVIDAWKAGYKDAEAWKSLRTNPALKFTARLEADLKLAGVAP